MRTLNIGAAVVALAVSLAGVSLVSCTARQGVTTNDLPGPVQATLEQNSRPGTIHSIVKETHEQRVLYKADVTNNGERWEVVIDGDGNLVYKKQR